MYGYLFLRSTFFLCWLVGLDPKFLHNGSQGVVGDAPSCALLVDLQSVHRFCYCDSIAPNAKCQQVLVLADVPVAESCDEDG